MTALPVSPTRASRPCIGVIVPPADGAVPPEATAMYGHAVDFIGVGLALERLTPDGYDAVQGRLGDAARQLRDAGAQAIALMGTSLSFYKGPAYNLELTRLLHAASGLPSVTMSTAVVDALRHCGSRRIAVATAYGDAVNQRLADFLTAQGFEVLSLEALAIEDVSQVSHVTQAHLVALAERSVKQAAAADGLLISCGGLRTLELSQTLQADLNIPVVSSSTAGPWAAVKLLGVDADVPGAPRVVS